jgi:hypothetical protein
MGYNIVIENGRGEVVLAIADPWRVGEEVAVGVWRKFNDQYYACLQPHRTQSDRAPDVAPALWVRRYEPGVIPPWTQPTGAHDCYNMGEKMIYTDGKTYESLINANVWSPEEHAVGWKNLSEPEEPEEYPAWVPWDGHNETLYQVGDKVSHVGKNWESTTPNNHWEPGVYGWVEIV